VEHAGIVPVLPVLARLARRLKRLDDREVTRIGLPRDTPTKLRIKGEELVAVILYVWPRAASAHMVLGKVQQKSLNLEQWIDFANRSD
jgi:hypothetical protein